MAKQKVQVIVGKKLVTPVNVILPTDVREVLLGCAIKANLKLSDMVRTAIYKSFRKELLNSSVDVKSAMLEIKEKSKHLAKVKSIKSMKANAKTKPKAKAKTSPKAKKEAA